MGIYDISFSLTSSLRGAIGFPLSKEEEKGGENGEKRNRCLRDLDTTGAEE